MALKYHSDHVLVSAFEDGQLISWHMNQQSILSTLQWSNEPLLCLDIVHDQGVVAGTSGNVCLFHVNVHGQLKKKKRLVLPAKGHAKVKLQESIIILGGWNNIISCLDMDSLQMIAEHKVHRGAISCIAIENDWLAVGSRDGTVSLWQFIAVSALQAKDTRIKSA
jgi:WD40 repeat protein